MVIQFIGECCKTGSATSSCQITRVAQRETTCPGVDGNNDHLCRADPHMQGMEVT